MSGDGRGEANGAGGHEPGCGCTRCVGFEPGNDVALRHGAYAVVTLTGRASEVAEAIRDVMLAEKLYRPAFAPTIEAAAVVLVRLERAERALSQLDEGLDAEGARPLAGYLGKPENRDALTRLRADARGWANTARGYLNDLGLSPASLARIARDTGVGKAARASAALRALEDHVEREYGAGRAEAGER